MGVSIRDTIALAQHCEALGYDRFWVSEHHSNDTIVGTAPEILLAAIGMVTKRIRIGSAGIMLPHYAPFKVAEQFRVLDAIAPGRIDLGLGRAPGSDGRTAFALNPLANERPAQFPGDVRDLMAWVSGSALPDGHPFRLVKANPSGETAPEIWILGSSDYGAQVAAHFGLPYAFAWFFADGASGEQALDIYRRLYQPSAAHPSAHTALCVWALAADTEEEARHHFSSRARFRLLRDRGIFARWRRPRPRWPTATRRPRRRAWPSSATAPSSARARRWRSGSRSWPSASTCRRWPSSPGPPTRPCGDAAISCWPRRWGLRREQRCNRPQSLPTAARTRGTARQVAQARRDC